MHSYETLSYEGDRLKSHNEYVFALLHVAGISLVGNLFMVGNLPRLLLYCSLDIVEILVYCSWIQEPATPSVGLKSIK